MKYLITDNNVKWDNTFANTMYFDTETARNGFVSTYLFTDGNYMQQLQAQPETYGVTLSPKGGTIEIEWTGDINELWTKNTIVLQESKKNAKPTFWFIDDIQQLDNNNMFELTLTPNLFLSYPGILEHDPTMELIEGHVASASLLDEKFDGGYRTMSSITGLDRNFDFEGTFDGWDINMMNNQWIYVFVKSTNDAAGTNEKLFKYNGQIMPYRVLIAPLNDIVVNSGDYYSNTIASFSETWESASYELQELDMNVPDLTDLTKERVIDMENPFLTGTDIDDDDITIVGSYDGVNKYITYTYDNFMNCYKDKWGPIYISSESESEISRVNNLLAAGTYVDKTSHSVDEKVVLKMKYNSSDNTISFKTLDQVSGNNDGIEFHDLIIANKYMYDERYWTVFVPGHWNKMYGVVPGDFTDKWVPYMSTVHGVTTIAVSTVNYSSHDWKVKFFRIYQGDEESAGENITWTNDTLMEFVNSQANAQDDASVVIIGGKISSFNPLHLNANSGGKIDNIRPFDGTEVGYIEGEVMELFFLNDDDSALMNTYDITKYQNKSWLDGIENYTIMIENGAEFKLKPELVYTDGVFTHQVVPTPNEWTERLIFEHDIHNEGYEFVNNKEFIFATNAFNEYQVNDPTAIKQQKFSNNLNLLKGATELAMSIPKGGVGAVAGVNAIGNNVVDRYNFRMNMRSMKERPVNITGSGSAMTELYMNKNAFGLSIVEWQYTTNQAPSIIKTLIRNGLSYDQPIVANFSKIKRPAFNFIQINNPYEVFSNNDYGVTINNAFGEVFNKGTRLWYDAETYLDYSVDNSEIINESMISYIDWNGERDKRKESN